jgi:hypothetical protein
MYERSALKSMIRALPAEIPGSEPPEFGIDERRQLFECLLITVTPVYEEPRNVMGRSRQM